MDFSFREKAAEGLAAFQQVLSFRAVARRSIKGRLRDDLIADRDIETRAEFAKLLFIELLLLVGDVAAFARFAKAIALDCLCKDDRGKAFVFDGRFIGRVDLPRVVAAPVHLAQLVVGEVIHQRQEFGVFPEKMFTNVAARRDGIFLEIAIDGLFHALDEQATRIFREQFVPIRAPDHLDDIPACAAENPFEFLDDFAIAAHRAVEALQVAVHDPNQIVEVLTGRKRQLTKRFGLIAFTVTDKAPDFWLSFPFHELARLQIAIEARLKNRGDWTQAHRDGRELPEFGHQIGVRIGGEAAALGQFLAEVV